jgi:hypothetical protein
MRAALTLLAILALALPAVAQDPDQPGCTQGNPCEVVVDLDSKGIDIAQTDFTVGDWLILSVFNGDNVTHSISMADPSVKVTVNRDDIEDSSPFQLAHVGSYTVTDSPTKDTATLTAAAADTFSGSTSGSSSAAKRSPGLEAVAQVSALAALAVALRRR